MTVIISKKHNIKFNIPVDRDAAEEVTIRVIIILSVIAAALAIICPIGYFKHERVYIEAGESISAADIAQDENAYFGDDFDPECVNIAGVHYFTVISGDKELSVRLKVTDTKAPEVVVKNVYTAVGGTIPIPEDFLVSVNEAGSFKGEYVKAFPKIKAMGTYSAQIQFTDAAGNKTPVYVVSVTIVSDSVPPEIKVLGEADTVVGEPIDYNKYVEITDNCTGKLVVDVDDSAVDLSTPGKYAVYFRATDAVGNVSERVKLTVVVREKILLDAQ